MRGDYVIMAIGLIVVAVVLTVIDGANVRLWDDRDEPDGAA